MKNSKKLIAAVAALVVALAVSVGSTFAWFTTNSKVAVTGIQANVTTGSSNLEVALVGVQGVKGLVGDFAYSLDLSKPIADGGLAEYFAATKFDALTDAGELKKPEATATDMSTWTWEGKTTYGQNLRNKAGEVVNDDRTITKTTENPGTDNAKDVYTVTSGSYLQFTLRFRTTAVAGTEEEKTNGIPLYLSAASKVTSAAGDTHSDLVAQNDITEFSITKGQTMTAKAQDAMRIAFHEADVEIPTESTTDDGEVDWADDTGATGVVWEPNATSGWGDTTKLAKGKFAQLVEESLTGVSSLAGLYTEPAYKAKENISADGEQIIKLVKDEDSDYFYADVTVVIWLEGTDEDCLNSIFGDKLTIALNFHVKEPKN